MTDDANRPGKPGLKILYLVISAALLTLAFPRFDLEILAFVAFIPMLYAMEGVKGSRAFWQGFIFGAHWFLFMFYWLVPVSMVGSLLMIAYQSLFIGLFFATVAYVRSNTKLPLVVYLPLFWAAVEYLRSIGYFGFPWGLVAHSQYKWLHLIQIVDVTGTMGLSLAIVAINVLIYYIIKNYRDVHVWLRAGGSIAGILLILNVYGFIATAPDEYEGEPVRIGLLQGNISQDIKWDPYYRDISMSIYRRLAMDAITEGADIVVWPETSLPFYIGENEFYLNQVYDIAEDSGTHHVLGCLDKRPRDFIRRERDYDVYNAAVLVTPGREIVDRYEKVNLVPFGEHIPFDRDVPIITDTLFAESGDFTKGPGDEIFETPYGDFGIYICFESIFPHIINEYSRMGSDFMVSITNEGWFEKSNEPYQHLAMSVFRAVENKTWLVRSANTGISCFITPNGRIVRKSEIYTRTQLTDDVYPRTRTTFYARHEKLFPYLFLGMALAVAGYAVFVSVRRYFERRKTKIAKGN
ncbi:MAG: apolipoprotein N-acyltransferase [bacterium]|nr:apolipoprotein N-acyltransferase [bacterium]